MIGRVYLIAAVAVAVGACASTAPQRASLQSPVYMVGDNAALSKASAAPMEAQGEFSVIKRVYWFFAGR